MVERKFWLGRSVRCSSMRRHLTRDMSPEAPSACPMADLTDPMATLRKGAPAANPAAASPAPPGSGPVAASP